jgi:hypothetical protein
MMNTATNARFVTVLAASLFLAACNGSTPDPDQVMAAADNATLVVYHDPSCGCCTKWLEHMKRSGYKVRDIRTSDMDKVKKRLNVPDHLRSCHTAVIGGYVIEGHVPAADIGRLLEERPEATGLSVPGMPVGSPGMEYQDRSQAYSVLLFDDSGNTRTFNRYPARL